MDIIINVLSTATRMLAWVSVGQRRGAHTRPPAVSQLMASLQCVYIGGSDPISLGAATLLLSRDCPGHGEQVCGERSHAGAPHRPRFLLSLLPLQCDCPAGQW